MSQPPQQQNGRAVFPSAIHPNGSLLTADDLAARWQVSRAHVYRLARDGHLPTVSIGRYYRFRLESIEACELESETRIGARVGC
jgi:excisionase family DNA binding protein